MAAKITFADLPREIRELIYDYAFEEVEPKFTNVLTSCTHYTPEKYPFLYMTKAMTEEIQPYLYGKHSMVIPIQEPCDYMLGKQSFAPQVALCSERMKRCTETLIIEASQTSISHYDDGFFEEYGNPEDVYAFWYEDDRGKKFAEKVTQEILALKANLPAVTKIKFIFWFGCWIADNNHWRESLEELQKEWPGLFLDFEFNLFGYVDHNPHREKDNLIQAWYHWHHETENTDFTAHNFKWADHVKGNFWGRFIDSEAYGYEDVPFYGIKGRIAMTHFGKCEVRPLYVKTAPLHNYAYLYHSLPLIAG